MNLKLKGIGLAVLAAIVAGSLAVVNASATEGGHFVSPGNTHAIVNQTSAVGAEHELAARVHGLEGEFVCDVATAQGTITTETVTSVTGNTLLEKCHTRPGETVTPVDMNGCVGTGTVAAGDPATTEQTAHLVCPAGNSIVLTHPNCTITVPPQTFNSGFTYTRITSNGKWAVTLDVNIQYSIQRHGLCQFIVPTNGTATVNGSTIIRGINTEGEQIDITAT